MRKLNILILIAALFTINVAMNGQIKQGNILITGNTSFDVSSLSYKTKASGTTTDNGSSFGISMNPQIGVCATDNLVLAIQLDISYSRFKSESGNIDRTTDMSGGPFLYYYFGESNVKPYIGAGVTLGKEYYKNIPAAGDGEGQTRNLFGAGAGAGVAAFLSESVALDASLSYQYQSRKYPDATSINSGLVFSIGFIFAIDPSKMGK